MHRISSVAQRLFASLVLLLILVLTGAAQSITPITQQIALPGSPFAVAVTPDGRYVFASLSGLAAGIAIIEQDRSSATLLGVLAINDPVFGLAVTSDGKYLLDTVQGTPAVQIIDIKQAVAGSAGAILGAIPLPYNAGPIEVALSNDDRFAFVANESNATVTVIDLKMAIASPTTAAIVGNIPVEIAPVGMAISPDDKLMYVTNEVANPTDPGYSATACTTSTGSTMPEGTLTVVDLRKAERDPADSVLASVYAGCSPVRVALSADGRIVWVTARMEDNLLAFDAKHLLDNPADALISRTPVGVAPVGLQLFDRGRRIAVANSNRFTTGQTGTVSIVSTSRALRNLGSAATLATFAAGQFPRQWALSPNGEYLYLTEFSSNLLAIFPVAPLLEDVKAADKE